MCLSLWRFCICWDDGCNLKHMGIFDLLSVWVLRSPAVCMSSKLCTHILGTHVVLIIGPSSNETHPYPICCTPPVKIFPLICNNSLQTFLQPKRGTLCYQNRFSDYPSHSRVAWWLQRSFCNWKVESLNLTADRLSISSSVSFGQSSEHLRRDSETKTGRPAGFREHLTQGLV